MWRFVFHKHAGNDFCPVVGDALELCAVSVLMITMSQQDCHKIAMDFSHCKRSERSHDATEMGCLRPAAWTIRLCGQTV